MRIQANLSVSQMKSSKQVSKENHLLLIKMGNGLKRTQTVETGIIASSDWSHFTQSECLADPNFQKIFCMLLLSCTFCFFNKLFHKTYGMQFHSDAMYVSESSYHGLYFGVIARMGSPFVMQTIGFKKTYSLLLCAQILVVFLYPTVASNLLLFRVWVILSMMCNDSTLSLFTPFANVVFGPE